MKKISKILMIILIVIIIGISGYLIYTKLINKENKDKEYVLSKFVETDSKIDKNSSINESNNFVFFKSGENYLEIYNKNGEEVTPKEIKNIKLNSISEVKVNDQFLGYTLQVDDKGYYINENAEIILNIETTRIYNYNTENYIAIDSEKVCEIDDNYNINYYCSKIYDLNGNLIIDGTKENYYFMRVIYNKNDTTLFTATKNIDRKVGIVDKNNNVIVDFKYSQIDYNESKNILIARKYQNSENIDIYNLEGKLLSEILIDTENRKKRYGFAFVDYSLNLDDSIYIIDDTYKLKKYDNAAWLPIAGQFDIEKQFIITDYIYIKNNNGTYTVHNLEGEKIIDTKFKTIIDIHEMTEGNTNGYITLCKDEVRKECGAIDFKGNIILNFENELYGYKESAIEEIIFLQKKGFKKGNQYFNIKDSKVTKKLTCENFNDNISEYLKNTIIFEENNGRKKIVDYNCNNLSESKYNIIYEYGEYIVAQNNNTYDVYDTNGILINYQNKDEGKLNNFLGYNNNKLYFGYNNAIYVLDNK